MQRGAPCCGLEPEETCLRARWEGCLAFLRAGFYFRDLGTIRSCFHLAKNQQCVSVSLGAGGGVRQQCRPWLYAQQTPSAKTTQGDSSVPSIVHPFAVVLSVSKNFKVFVIILIMDKLLLKLSCIYNTLRN